MSNFTTIFADNWDEIREKLKNYWDKLTENDVKKMDGSYDAFISKLKKAYGYSQEEVEQEFQAFLESEGLQSLKHKAKEMFDHAAEITDAVKHSIQDSLGDGKEKLQDLQEAVADYAKKNPFKALGAAMVAGVIIGKILKKI